MLRLQGHSVARLKLPTEFAEFDTNLLTLKKEYIDCSGCENVGVSDRVIDTLSEAIKRRPELVWDHWNPQDLNIRSKIAQLHQVDVNQVFITSGAIAGIDYCFKIFCNAGSKVGLLKPDWPGFEHYADFYRSEKFYLTNRVYPFSFTAEQISSFVSCKKIDLMVFANPIPVQGHLLDSRAVEQILASNAETLFVIDEADAICPEIQSACLVSKYNNAVFLIVGISTIPST